MKISPSPAYPFEVDLSLANEGKVIFETNCQGCHNVQVTVDGRDTNLESLNTDPNRAHSITSPMSMLLAEKILEACKDKRLEECQKKPNGDTQHVLKDAKPGYKTDTLGGIWARAPYLHNGSIPTMRHLLQPSTRPNKFCRGSLDYDSDNMGFGWKRENSVCLGEDHQVLFEAGLPSQKNTGHAGNIYLGLEGDLSDEAADALIEYMKTF